jgi:hypothetical protein
MIAHVQGQTINYSRLGTSLNISDNSVRHYLELLSGAFIVRILQPFHDNLKKRLIKSPKVYIRDTGLLHALLGIESIDMLFGHPIFGSSWESVAIENILAHLKSSVVSSFYRTAKGEEMDLILEFGLKKIAIECKATTSPDITRSMATAINDLSPEHVFIIAPVKETYPLSPMVTVTSIVELLKQPAFLDFIYNS